MCFVFQNSVSPLRDILIKRSTCACVVIFVYKTHYVWSLSLKVPSGWSRPWADGCLSVNYWRIERVIKCDAARRPIHRECNDCRSRALQLTEWNYNGACCTESRKAFQVNTLAEEEAPWAAGGSWRAAGGSNLRRLRKLKGLRARKVLRNDLG